MKGQSSVEFVSIIGIALVLAAPFVIESQDTMINLITDSEAAEFQASLNDMGDAATQVAASGEKSSRTIEITIPDNVENIYEQDRALIFEMDRGGSLQNFSQIFPATTNSNITTDQGLKTVKIKFKTSELHLEQK